MKVNNKYTFFKKLTLFCWLIRTKFISRHARIIRFPIDIRGRKYIDFGKNITTGVGCRLEAFSENGEITMIFNDNVQINDYVHISSMGKVYIGNNVLMASRIYISDNSHGCYKGIEADSSPSIIPIKRDYHIASVIIEDNVWIGEGCVILPGVTIGMGSIIGANSVVSKDIPSNVIAVGSPAVPIKEYNKFTNKWERI